MKNNFNKLYKMIMEDTNLISKEHVIKEDNENKQWPWDYMDQTEPAKITKQDWLEIKKELEPYFIDHMKKIKCWYGYDEDWKEFLLSNLGDSDPTHIIGWRDWDRETFKKRWMGRIRQINGKWIEKLALPFDLKDARERADRYWGYIQALPEQVKNMNKEQVEESMQKITAALENDSDWEKQEDGKWEYDGYDTAAEAIAKICEDCLPIDIDCFNDYWEASDEVARLEYIEENGDDEDFEVDSTGCGYDEWITEFDEYINVGWLKDFLDSIIEW